MPGIGESRLRIFRPLLEWTFAWACSNVDAQAFHPINSRIHRNAGHLITDFPFGGGLLGDNLVLLLGFSSRAATSALVRSTSTRFRGSPPNRFAQCCKKRTRSLRTWYSRTTW